MTASGVDLKGDRHPPVPFFYPGKCNAYFNASSRSCCFSRGSVATKWVSFDLNIRDRKSHRTELYSGRPSSGPRTNSLRIPRMLR